MKTRIICAITIALSVALLTSNVNATETKTKYMPFEDYVYMRCTGYTDNGLTKSGKPVRKGICAVGNQYYGATAFVYSVSSDGNVGQLLGIYECLDTGYGAYDKETGLGTIQAGKTIDIWYESIEEVYAFSAEYGDYVWVEFRWDCVG